MSFEIATENGGGAVSISFLYLALCFLLTKSWAILRW